MSPLPEVGLWVPPAPRRAGHGLPHPLLAQLDALVTATAAAVLVLPVTSTRQLPARIPPLPFSLVLDLTARLTQIRTVPLTGASLSLLCTYCRLLHPHAVLVAPRPGLRLPSLPTSTAWWVLTPPTALQAPTPTVWDLGAGAPLPVAPWTPPSAVLLRTADGLPALQTPGQRALLLALHAAYPTAPLLLPPDHTPYQLRTALDLHALQSLLRPVTTPAP